MIRHAALVAFAISLTPSWLCAQSIQFTVTTESADIHKSPSTASPVVGHVPRGTVLEVTRELGSWVKISWPAAPDAAAYMHVSWGTITRRSSADQTRTTAVATPRSSADSAPASTANVRAERPGGAGRSTPVSPSLGTVYVVPPGHLLGLGGRVGGPVLGYGGTARVWSGERLGIQLEVSRAQLTSPGVPGRATSVQFAPSLLYSFRNHVTDFVWVRPYVGAGAGLHRQTLIPPPGAGASVSDSSLGVQASGGGEFTFASVPRLALGADVGYRWVRTPFAGVDFGGLGLSVSAHWYVK